MRQKKWVLRGICVILVLVVGVIMTCLKTENEALVSGEKIDEISIVIDPGHGGFDGGAVAKDGTVEKDINLAISQKLKEIMEEYKVKVTMTRTDDSSLNSKVESIHKMKEEDMKRRRQIIEDAEADLTISIHLNSYPSDASVYGAQVFYAIGKQKRTGDKSCEQLSKKYGENIQKSLETNIKDGRERSSMAKLDTYLLKNVHTPYVLVECGFLSNENELKRLKTAEYQQLIAASIWEGINNELRLKKEQKMQIIQSANKQ